MARPLTAGVLAALAAGTLRPAVLTEVFVEGGVVRNWSGVGDIVNPGDGQTYQGVGRQGEINEIEESIDLVASGMVLKLAAAESVMIATAMSSFRQGKRINIYIAFLDATGAIIPDPLVAWSGFADVPKLALGAGRAELAISAESRLLELEREIGRKYTDEDQRRHHPTDRGFAFLPLLQDKEIPFGPST